MTKPRKIRPTKLPENKSRYLTKDGEKRAVALSRSVDRTGQNQSATFEANGSWGLAVAFDVSKPVGLSSEGGWKLLYRFASSSA